MAYTKRGPFANDVGPPWLEAAFVNPLEDWAEATGTKIDGIATGADVTPATVMHAVVQTAAAGAIASRPAGVPDGFVQWLLYDDPTGEALGIQDNDLVFNISGVEW